MRGGSTLHWKCQASNAIWTFDAVDASYMLPTKSWLCCPRDSSLCWRCGIIGPSIRSKVAWLVLFAPVGFRARHYRKAVLLESCVLAIGVVCRYGRSCWIWHAAANRSRCREVRIGWHKVCCSRAPRDIIDQNTNIHSVDSRR